MLPSKGYFSPLPCPFYESGECLRPHCHFRHTKKDKATDSSDSSTSEATIKENNTDVSRIQGLINTVKVSSHLSLTENEGGTSKAGGINSVPEATLECNKKDFSEVPSYKPTPISELNKRHIPVAYAPTRPIGLVRRKEVKESLTYFPRSISKSAYSSSNAYVPSSAGASSSFTYQPTKISPSFSVDDCRTLLNEKELVSDEDKLLVLDRLVDEEFGSHYNSFSVNDDKTEDEVFSESDFASSTDLKLSTETENPLPLAVNSFDKDRELPEISSTSGQKKPSNSSKTETACKKESSNEKKPELSSDKKKSQSHKHQLSSKHSSESKSKSDDKSRSSHTKSDHHHRKSSSSSREKNTKENNKVDSHSKENKAYSHSKDNKANDNLKDKKADSHSKDKAKHLSHHKEASSSDHSKSKPKASHSSELNVKTKSSSTNKCKEDSSNKTRSLSKDSKHKNSSHKKTEETSSKHSSSKKHEDVPKPKISSSSKSDGHSKPKPDVSSKDEKPNYSIPKEKSRLSDHPVKLDKHRSLLDKEKYREKKCRKKKKVEDEKNSHKDLELSPPPSKLAKIEISSDEESNNYLANVSNEDSDVEEVVMEDEPIIIDSSSNSSTSYFASGNIKSDESDASSDSPPSSPPPVKKFRLEECDRNPVSSSALQSILCERWRKARETVLTKSTVPGKIKIFQVPNVKKLLNAKDELLRAKERMKKPHPPPTSSYSELDQVEEYVPRPIVRTAHAPKESIARYPSVKIEDNLKVPHSIRQSCLNNIYDEYMKYVSPDKASHLAVEKELEICRRTKVAKTYQNACAMAVLKIRKTKGKDNCDDGNEREVKKEGLQSYSVPDFTHGWSMYRCFKPYLLSEDDILSNGFPIPLESYKGCGYIDKGARRFYVKQPDDECMRICVHCSKNYFIDPETGFPLEENDCFYHWGKLRRIRGRGGVNETYICCGGDVGSEPCSSGRYHVCNLYDEDCLEGFVKTPSISANLPEDAAGIYGLDCEMCYSTQGIDLTRVTVVNLDGDIVYDKIVLPDYPILDYCTRFSGMTEALLKTADKKLKDVQRDLLTFINEKTILVGHSLENDLKALRIFHNYVVDTSVVFPHKLGPPYKKSLKHVAKEVLNINIQEKESGHDSKEDANTSLQLMLWKIKEDAKGRKPRVIISLDSRNPSSTR